MLRPYSPARGVGILALLFPALLLLPTLHLHPEYAYAHRTDGAHKHLPVVHADFLPVPAHDHGEHQRGHNVPGNTSSQPLYQISLSILLPRNPVLLLLILERAPVFFLVEAPIVSSAFSFHTWVLTTDHPLPVQDISLNPKSSRSPPHFA